MICPFCGAPLEESARYCMACMRELAPKRTLKTKLNTKVFLSCLTAGLLVVFVVLGLPLLPPAAGAGQSISASLPSSQSRQSAPAPLSSSASSSAAPSSSTPVMTPPPSPSASAQEPQYSSTQSQCLINDRLETVYNYKDRQIDTWTFREMKTEDFPNLAMPAQGLTLHKTDGLWPLSTIVMPDRIDGRTIAAIGSGAFDDSRGEPWDLYLPATLLAIDSFAFSRSNVRVLYFEGEALDIHRYAFYSNPDTIAQPGIILRCSATCVDGLGRPYRDVAGEYGLIWEELS